MRANVRVCLHTKAVEVNFTRAIPWQHCCLLCYSSVFFSLFCYFFGAMHQNHWAAQSNSEIADKHSMRLFGRINGLPFFFLSSHGIVRFVLFAVLNVSNLTTFGFVFCVCFHDIWRAISDDEDSPEWKKNNRLAATKFGGCTYEPRRIAAAFCTFRIFV